VQRPDWHVIKTQCVRWAYWGRAGPKKRARKKKNRKRIYIFLYIYLT
jgi:hypothetical protein